MPEMTTRQRIALMFQHAQPDRVPLFEQPWASTIARWRQEGMGDRDYIDYFGLDRVVMMGVDNSPRYPTRTVEETEEYRIVTTSWDVRPFVPRLVDLGLDGLHPLEVKAGMDPLAVKRDHGDRLLIHGGFNALLWPDVDRMEATVREWLPILMQSGGYVFSTDHSTPSNATGQAFRRIVEVVKEVGAY